MILEDPGARSRSARRCSPRASWSAFVQVLVSASVRGCHSERPKRHPSRPPVCPWRAGGRDGWRSRGRCRRSPPAVPFLAVDQQVPAGVGLPVAFTPTADDRRQSAHATMACMDPTQSVAELKRLPTLLPRSIIEPRTTGNAHIPPGCSTSETQEHLTGPHQKPP